MEHQCSACKQWYSFGCVFTCLTCNELFCAYCWGEERYNDECPAHRRPPGDIGRVENGKMPNEPW